LAVEKGALMAALKAEKTDAAKAALAESKKLKREIKAMENRRTSVISQLAESMGYTKEEALVKMSELAHDICLWSTVEDHYVKKPDFC
jgi:t-SNARE complex subunit (syntaxin)